MLLRKTLIWEHVLLSAGFALFEVCVNSWSLLGWARVFGSSLWICWDYKPMKGQKWRPMFLWVIVVQNKKSESNLWAVLRHLALTKAIILILKQLYFQPLRFKLWVKYFQTVLSGSHLAPCLLTACWLSRKHPLHPLLLQSWALAGSRLVRYCPQPSPWQQWTTQILRGLEWTGQRWGLHSSLQPTICWSICLPERKRMECTSLEVDRLQARQTDENLELVIGSLDQTWDTQLNESLQGKGDPRITMWFRISWPVLQKKRKRKLSHTCWTFRDKGKILASSYSSIHSCLAGLPSWSSAQDPEISTLVSSWSKLLGLQVYIDWAREASFSAEFIHRISFLDLYCHSAPGMGNTVSTF